MAISPTLSADFRVPELAGRCGLSVSQLNRLFRHHHGCTPATLFAERKREYARRQVQTGQMPFKEIGCALGFSAPSHFSTWFRKQFGEAPRTHRSDATAAAFDCAQAGKARRSQRLPNHRSRVL